MVVRPDPLLNIVQENEPNLHILWSRMVFLRLKTKNAQLCIFTVNCYHMTDHMAGHMTFPKQIPRADFCLSTFQLALLRILFFDLSKIKMYQPGKNCSASRIS